MCTVDTPYVTGYMDIGRIFRLNTPANILDFPEKMSVIQGRTLKLNCKAQGFPQPKITWYIGNIVASHLKDSDIRITIYSLADGGQVNSFLAIRDVSEEDSSLYTCRAENSIDSGLSVVYDEESVFVHVRENMIEPNEDEPGMGKLLIPGERLVLQCNTSECPHCTVVWFKDDKLLEPMPGHLEIYEKNNSVLIEQSSYNDSGVYVCAIDRKQLDVALNATIVVQSKIKLEKFEQSSVVVQGSPLELYCLAKGAPMPHIKWFIGDEEVDDDNERVKLLDHEGLKKGKLMIEEADFQDRNYYTCEAYNQIDSVNATIFIRIKDKLAALWPFLGICAEVAILCSIIFVYERRKSMTQCDEPDTDLPTDNKHHRDQKMKGQDVRQRK
ncbi:Peroxidasin-like protein, partial [Stegodyphus mimosarum]